MIPSRQAAAEVSLALNAHPERDRVDILGTDFRIAVDLLAMSLPMTRRSGLPSIASRCASGANQLAGSSDGLRE